MPTKNIPKSVLVKEVSHKIDLVKDFCKSNKLPYVDKIVDGTFDDAVFNFKKSSPKSWKRFETKIQKKAEILDIDADGRNNVKVTFSSGVKSIGTKDIPAKLYRIWSKTLDSDPTDYIF